MILISTPCEPFCGLPEQHRRLVHHAFDERAVRVCLHGLLGNGMSGGKESVVTENVPNAEIGGTGLRATEHGSLSSNREIDLSEMETIV
jgi:hypothetical protein